MPVFNLRIDEENEIRLDYEDTQVSEVNRCDFVNKVGTVRRTDEGYLRGDAAIAKVGILSYLMPDGTLRRELVPPETLFKSDDMKTLHLQPITNTHPKEVLLDSKTIKRRKVGSTGEQIRRDGDYLMSSVVITDDDAIKTVENGRRQLSPGYRASVLNKPGAFQGMKYDAIQIKRVYNHVALCDKARGGADLKINFDSVEIDKLDGFELSSDTNNNINPNPSKKETQMPQINIDGINYEAAQEVINRVNKLMTRVDELTGTTAKLDSEKTTVQEQHDSIAAERDTLKEEVEKLKKQDHSDEIEKAARARIKVLDVARTVLDSEQVKKLDEMSIDEIKKVVILAKAPKANLDGQSDVYVSARYDAIVENIDFDPEAIAHQRRASGKRTDASNIGTPEERVEKARIDSEEKIRNSYQELDKRFK